MVRRRFFRRVSAKRLLIFVIGVCVIVFYCEFLIYYVVVYQCSWPAPSPALRALLVSDPHLLGPRRGHRLDRWRRERQMAAAFGAVVAVHAPDAVFFLGDLFDEGALSRESQFSEYVERFRELFPVPPGTEMFVVAGNHDIGFHNEITANRANRFERLLGAPPARLVTLKGSHFVLLNSMALEGDRCTLCRAAVKEIEEISETLCAGDCNLSSDVLNYSRPVILQHFPLYRESDETCSGPEAAPPAEKTVPFRNKIDCLSREATHFLVTKLRPRAVFGGHTHHGCEVNHAIADEAFTEYSVPSFSWRNRPDPRYYLVSLTPEHVAVSKCGLPRETTIAATALISLALLSYVVVKWNYLKRRYWGGNRWLSGDS